MVNMVLKGELMPKVPRVKAGLVLEELVSDELERLNVPHTRTTHGGHQDVSEHIDFCVHAPPFSGRPKFEIQLTLRKSERHMRSFVLAALSNKDRGVRVYLHVRASFQKGLFYIASRVARAIRDIVRNFRRFEEHDLLGVRLRVGRTKRGPHIERFSLMSLVGEWVMGRIERQAHAAARLLEEVKPKRKVALAELQSHLKSLRGARRFLYPSTQGYRSRNHFPPRNNLRGHPVPRRVFMPLRHA